MPALKEMVVNPTASASLMTEYLKHKTLDEAETLFKNFHQLMMDQSITDEKSMQQQFGKLTVLAGVREFPARVKCATLAWHTLKAALQHLNEPVSTE